MSMFISVSRAGESLLPLAQQFSQEWSIPLLRSRPLPQEGVGLIFQHQGPALYAPPTPPKLWHPGFSKNRFRAREHDPLIRALGGPELSGVTVLDGTFGMGHDALLMSRCGARVIAYEQSPLIAYYSLRGIAAFDLDAATRLSVRVGDHGEHPLAERVDFVYLDPMFPKPSSAGWRSSPTLSSLRAEGARDEGLSREETLSLARLERARRLARRGVIVKLAPNERAPELAADAELSLIKSNRVRLALISPHQAEEGES